MPRHRLLSAAILALVLALTAGGDVLAGRANYPEKDKEIIAITFAGEMMKGGYKAITAEQLKKWIDEKKDMLIVDTRPLEAKYKKKHVPAAVQIEFPIPEMKQMDEKKKAEFTKLLGQNKDRPIVFYCGFVECTRSHNAAMWATNLGYKNVYRFPGGMMGWTQAGYPTAKGEK